MVIALAAIHSQDSMRDQEAQLSQLEKLRAANREAMITANKTFVAELEPVEPGTEWDRLDNTLDKAKFQFILMQLPILASFYLKSTDNIDKSVFIMGKLSKNLFILGVIVCSLWGLLLGAMKLFWDPKRVLFFHLIIYLPEIRW